MLISKQEFLSVKVREKSKYNIIFKFVGTLQCQGVLVFVVFRPTNWPVNTEATITGNVDYINFIIIWDTSPILYLSFFFKIKFSVIKEDFWYLKYQADFATHCHWKKLHIWKILNINANVCVPCWAPKCAGISTKIHQCWFQSRNFYLWKLAKKSKYPIIFKFVFITNVASFSAKEC